MSRLQSCSRIFEKSSAVAEKKIPENRTFSEKSEKMRALSRYYWAFFKESKIIAYRLDV
jgi:hypothetical protein